jgi:four helix bundle protein
MILKLAHTKLDVFQVTRTLVKDIYKLSMRFPAEEKFAMTSQVRRAATSIHLNLAEGSSRKSDKEKARFYEISRSSLVEVDTALDLAEYLEFIQQSEIDAIAPDVIKCFTMLTSMMEKNRGE